MTMELELWKFWVYSFLGCIMETCYVRGRGSMKRGIKGFLLLPLCPVYGLGVLAVLALPKALTAGFFSRALWGGLTATAVEYVVHWAYEVLLGVHFWDYSHFRGNLKGRVCLPYSLIWGVLLTALPIVDRFLTPRLEAIPSKVTWVSLVVFLVDACISFWILYQTGDPASLCLTPE